MVQVHPRKEDELLVCPMKHPPVLVNLSDGGGKPDVLELEDEAADAQIVAAYDHRGEHLFTGNSKGRVCVFKDRKMVASFKVTQAVSSTTAIKSIEFSRRSKCFLVNTADRVIRIYRTSQVIGLKEGAK